MSPARPVRLPLALVVLAGVAAALHVGKLPPALPVLRETLGLSLPQAGFLLSTVQLAGMLLGALVGLAADSIGLRRCMVAGLLLLAAASAASAAVSGVGPLLALRAAEGLGLLLTAMPAPGLMRRLLQGRRADAWLGLWGTYMPTGTALALLVAPVLLHGYDWRLLWLAMSLPSALLAALFLARIPPDPPASPREPGRSAGPLARLARTLGAPGPWLLGASFAVYAGQWLAVIGFLPSIHAKAGFGQALGTLTALMAAVNMIGNVAGGRLLQRGVPAPRLLATGFGTMGLGACVAFVPAFGAGPLAQYVAIGLFSMVGGLVPATLFALSLRLAPDAGQVSTTVGLMQQGSAFGQFVVPPLVGLVAARAGGWQWTGLVTGTCAVAGLLLSRAIAVRLSRDSGPRS